MVYFKVYHTIKKMNPLILLFSNTLKIDNVRRSLVVVKRDITKIMSCLISEHFGLILKYAFACIFDMSHASA